MRLTKKKSSARKAAVLQFFLSHPDATGDEAQEALASGKLTGQKGPPLSTGSLYELQRRAREMARQGPVLEMSPAPPSGEAMAALHRHVAAIQKTLAALPSVAQVIIARDGAHIVRLEPRREKL